MLGRKYKILDILQGTELRLCIGLHVCLFVLNYPLEQSGTSWIEERECNIANIWSSDWHEWLLRDFLRTGRPNNQF